MFNINKTKSSSSPNLKVEVKEKPKPEITSIQVYKVINGYSLQGYSESEPIVRKVTLDKQGIHDFVNEMFDNE